MLSETKRLLKTFDRYHLEPARMLLRILGVPAVRNHEEIHIRTSRSDRLLLDSANREHGAVERELASGRDLASVGDVASELARDLERKGDRPGPPTRPRSMSTSKGSLMSAS